MSKLQVNGPDLNKLLKLLVGDGCAFEKGVLHYTSAKAKVQASEIQLLAKVEVETRGLRIHGQAVKFNRDGAEVDFEIG
ncbi:MAG: hypothetical protein WC789_12420 [Lentisphaeria bacterium]|jgi:hypothetical protein